MMTFGAALALLAVSIPIALGLGAEFMPPAIHAGGLRYHGDSPIVSALVKAGRMEAVACPQSKVFEAATLFARTEGKLPAPETAHAIRAAIDPGT